VFEATFSDTNRSALIDDDRASRLASAKASIAAARADGADEVIGTSPPRTVCATSTKTPTCAGSQAVST
jgi:hypothetical protein